MYWMDHQGSSCLAILHSEASLIYAYISCSFLQRFIFYFPKLLFDCREKVEGFEHFSLRQHDFHVLL